jgi:hypothetical protein
MEDKVIGSGMLEPPYLAGVKDIEGEIEYADALNKNLVGLSIGFGGTSGKEYVLEMGVQGINRAVEILTAIQKEIQDKIYN